jgi:hypothetical protein
VLSINVVLSQREQWCYAKWFCHVFQQRKRNKELYVRKDKIDAIIVNDKYTLALAP